MTFPVTPPSGIRSVYLHAPFCASRCPYCDFAVSVTDVDLQAWTESIQVELGWLETDPLFRLAPVLETVYVGGGTPSLLGPGAMAAVRSLLGQERMSHPGLEWTAEANPDSFSPSLASAWAQAGVNRLSLGVQSFHSEVLRRLSRRHTPQEAVAAVGIAREAGLTNLTIDLIFGLPSEFDRDWDRDLDVALSLGVPHVSLYGLTVESGTALAERVDQGVVSTPSEETYRTEYLRAAERLIEAGYVHYEVSNFALPGAESQHNLTYWELRPYVGLGNSAHSFRGGKRRWNLKDWGDYQAACAEGRPPWSGEEPVGTSEARLERIWLGLRTSNGVPLADLNSRARALAEEWVSRGLGSTDGGAVRLKPAGWLLLDELVVDMELALS